MPLWQRSEIQEVLPTALTLALMPACRTPMGESLESCEACEACGREIPQARRKAVAGVKLCVGCQSELEEA